RLLNHMGELMRDQLPTRHRMRRVFPGVEYQVASHGVRHSVHRLRGLRRPLACMNSDLAEVVAETAFHEGAGGRVERLPRRAQRFVDDGWNLILIRSKPLRSRGLSLQGSFR